MAWDEALSADRPVILECYTDPNVPPLPPHITLKDAKNFMAMTGTEPELGKVCFEEHRETIIRESVAFRYPVQHNLNMKDHVMQAGHLAVRGKARTAPSIH